MRRGCALALAMIGLALFSVADAQEVETLEIGGGKIEVAFGSPPTVAQRSLVLDWVSSCARAVTVYYEQFPVARVLIRIRFFDGRGVRSGQTFGWNGGLIKIAVGQSNSATDFARDWMMTHEMVHLAFPSVVERHHWIEEGLSTYVESVSRARTGDLTPEKAWGDLVDGLPQGLPQSGDRGLDFTPTWGRTYWGGALFCLLADVEIRQRTENRKGLENALRAILQAGGTIQSDWELTRALAIGDRAVGVPVLTELYGQMKSAPAPVDLEALWKKLGVKRQDGRTEFDDAAPLAPIRKAIMRAN
ncbi:MAG: hypothetical protein H0U99_03125 [Chthoniobacterales bacterium]|nr:hypothetical protein [Chthoniobacterales bacterium]